ncbi:diacylglycerol kinase family protein [Sinomonas sp. ASV322]|uniref:diacylglycerol/lipid kinase family protein n=1 Tax=Sinomonas sp. ASV322 TaxID=3041920 RepID=UPI0027DC9BBF|nr:diacylglycerol kinase family protein [Sinomonas sp. ASV322]MDQ4501428.1 diacylglycerol kinase family protein [Sinomonas sp. ASV322]
MRNWIIAGALAAAGAFAVTSWWGVRRLREQHSRSAVAEPAQMPEPGPQQVAVILNPTKARASEAEMLIEAACRGAGWPSPLVFETTADDPGHSMARAALEAGADVVIPCGGDGTVRVVAEALAGTDVALGLVPLGTGNLLARNLDLDLTRLAQCVHTALFGRQRRIDTATMALENRATGAKSQHTFLVIAGMGMDAEILGDTNEDLKKAVGWIAYTEAGIRHMPGRRRKKVDVALDDGDFQTRSVRSVLFANCSKLPGGVDFIPEAYIDDGVLDIVVMSPRSLLGWLEMWLKITFQHNRPLPVMSFYGAQSVRIRSAQPVETQVDGDPTGPATDIRVEVRPLSLLVRVAG